MFTTFPRAPGGRAAPLQGLFTKLDRHTRSQELGPQSDSHCPWPTHTGAASSHSSHVGHSRAKPAGAARISQCVLLPPRVFPYPPAWMLPTCKQAHTGAGHRPHHGSGDPGVSTHICLFHTTPGCTPRSLHLLPEPTNTSGLPKVTAAVKSEPRYSPSTCQFTNFDCWVCREERGVRAARGLGGCARAHVDAATSSHLDGHLGPEPRAQLMDDLSVEAATVVHVPHQHGECLWAESRGWRPTLRAHSHPRPGSPGHPKHITRIWPRLSPLRAA